MVGESIEGRARGGQQILALELAVRHPCRHERNSLSHGTGAEDRHPWSCLLHECPEDGDVARVGRGIVALRRAPYLREGGFVHVLRRCDAAADGFRIGQELPRLRGSPDARGIARPRASGKGGDDAVVHRARKIHYALPLAAGQHSIEARGRVGRGRLL